MDIGDIMTVLDGMETNLVSFAVGDAALDAAAGQPHREAENVMIAAIRTLRAGRAAKLRGEDNQRFIEQAAALQILEQPGDGLIYLQAVVGVVGPQPAVSVPHPRAAGPVLNLDETHAALHQSARRQQLHPKIARLRPI